jgi:hypothetical protein
MKLSDKILLAFFGFIFIYLTAAFVEVRLSGTLNVIDDRNSKAETVDIAGVAYLILTDLDKTVDVLGSDRAQLVVRSLSGDVLKNLKYQLSGDTLTVSGVGTMINDPVRIYVFVPGNLKGITVNSSDAVVRNLQLENLKISQNSGRISMSDNRISSMELNLSNHSFLDVSGGSTDTLSAAIERSQVNIYSPVGVLHGSMKENSSLHLRDLRDIKLTKDESSILSLY